MNGLVLSHFDFEGFRTVMPAQAGIQGEQAAASGYAAWIPACAGMTQHSSTPQNHRDRLLGSLPLTKVEAEIRVHGVNDQGDWEFVSSVWGHLAMRVASLSPRREAE